MSIDVDQALTALARPLGPVPPVEGAPAHELARSPAAAAVARHAATEQLLLFHFETRGQLELPPSWVTPGSDPSLPVWTDGVLPEPKYASFRHDLPIGSFHPGHRAKWSAHELCHALVGFAWRPDASPLFHATAGRLAELVPVVLWYFLDEVRLARCERHAEPQFRRLCPDCEAAARRGPRPLDESRDRDLLEQARRFVERELAALARTRRLGRPCPHVWGSLDLCSDGIAYADAHGPRLTHPDFLAFAERYLEHGRGGAHASLDDLEERALAVLAAICEDRPLAALGGDRALWTTRDVGCRLLQAVGGEASEAKPFWDLLDAGDPLALVTAYAEVAERRGWPHPGDVFAVGYPLWGAGHSVDQVDEGLRTVVPVTLQLADDAEVDWAEPFTAHDAAAPRQRVPIGQRFADWLSTLDATLGGLAHYEVAVRSPTLDTEATVLGTGEGARWADGIRRWRGAFDPVDYAEAVTSGSVEARPDDAAPAGLAVAAPPERPTHLVMGRDRSGDLVLAQLPAELEDPGDLAPDDPVLTDLRALGLVAAQRWPT